jgi:hypothetical protein
VVAADGPSPVADPETAYRRRIYTEILETEKSYASDLQVLVKYFKMPLQE